MADRRINSGLVVSATAHAAVLLWAAVSFAAKPLDTPPTETLFAETIALSEFSRMMAGTKSAQQKHAPKPLVEKKAEARSVENQAAPVSEKPEIVTASAAAPPPDAAPTPKPAPRQVRQEPAPPQPEKKQPAKVEPEKIEPDAEALKKTDKKETHKQEKQQQVKPMPPRRPPQKKLAEKQQQQQREPSQFDADQIAALLDKRQPRRLAAAGETLNPTPALGVARGTAPQLSQNEIDMLRARIQQCWNPPAGQAGAQELTVLVRIQFNQDGSLAGEPRLMSRVSPGYQQVAAESALRAIRRCAPYSFMPAAKYDAWKDIEVNFDPRDLFRG